MWDSCCGCVRGVLTEKGVGQGSWLPVPVPVQSSLSSCPIPPSSTLMPTAPPTQPDSVLLGGCQFSTLSSLVLPGLF